jgi:hypothetical protein
MGESKRRRDHDFDPSGHDLIMMTHCMMTPVFRAALVAAIATASSATIAAGQDVSSGGLFRRIDSLQRRTEVLERRVSELEAVLRVEPLRSRAARVSANPRDVANWRRLRRSMTMEEVRALLGEPERVQAGYTTVWYYPNSAHIMFDADKADSWLEPRQ